MSYIINNLECTGCDFFDEEVMYRRNEAETKEDYDRYIKTIEERFPGKRVNIQGETPAQKADRLDTMRHNSYKRKKAKGLDDKMLKEVSTHTKRLKSEGRKQTKSAAQLVGGK